MNLGTQKWKKARANFSGVRDDAGRCGTACTRACPWDAHCLPARGKITSFSKKPSFLGNHSKYVAKARSQGMQRRPRPRHASKAKAKAAPYGHAAKAGACSSQGQGSPHGQAAKAKACLRACCQGQGTQPRPWHACVGTLACPWVQAGGHAGMPLGAGSSKALACTLPEGQWQHGEGDACPVGGMPRPWHALGTPTRPWQHLGGLLLPSLDSLFGHLLLFPP